MLVKLSVENYKSFDQKEELSMISSSKMQGNKSHRVKIKQTQILKNAIVYGANASGKSNLVAVFAFIKAALMEGIPVGSANDFCRNRQENKNRESVFEIQFTAGDTFYAYGFSAILSQRKITEEWLYELMQDGSAHQLFLREGNNAPILGDTVKLSTAEKGRFSVYSEDFAGQDTQLFLTEMNRGKKYPEKSKLIFFVEAFGWIMNNIIVINPNIGISNTEAYYNDESLENISKLIQTFDTGVTEIKTRQITIDEMGKMIPAEVVQGIFSQLKAQLQISNLPSIQMTWRVEGGFFNIRIKDGQEPEISTLVLRHGKSVFDFNFSEESDGTKRLFDLIDMLLTERPDTVFVVDELERSLHPKLTEHFLMLFMEAHDGVRMQLVFTTHEDTIMDQSLFRRDEIWFVERDSDNASKIYSLDRFKERYDKKLSKAYLEGRYGAIPVFRQFSFRKDTERPGDVRLARTEAKRR
ncbi:MAG: ATP-binding protein [Butyrivibrio sp.]|uniref:AAA family ATPase n=1 Tax=Butyrivibrio sp. TaxID=28121 RepID=UPI0025DD5C18|nr:AAA family ATPase [Butyrivibrio sp.]MCR5770304.1 ATP-binding protein [Butyrivibrio sp.]